MRRPARRAMPRLPRPQSLIGVTTMSNPRNGDGFRSPRGELAPGVVLVCETCDHVWEPSPAELGAGPVTCTQCGGWTTIAELATTAGIGSIRARRD